MGVSGWSWAYGAHTQRVQSLEAREVERQPDPEMRELPSRFCPPERKALRSSPAPPSQAVASCRKGQNRPWKHAPKICFKQSIKTCKINNACSGQGRRGPLVCPCSSFSTSCWLGAGLQHRRKIQGNSAAGGEVTFGVHQSLGRPRCKLLCFPAHCPRPCCQQNGPAGGG